MTHELWANLNAHIFAYLRGVTLAQLVTQQHRPGVAVMQDHRAQSTGTRAPEPARVA
jgi:DNA-binding IscR family transcriptional regulator